MSWINLRTSEELAKVLALPSPNEDVYTTSVISLVGMLVTRFKFPLSIEAFERNHITTQMASAAAYGFVERNTAISTAFDLAAFIEFDSPNTMTKLDALVWLTAIFKVYFDIRYDGGMLNDVEPEAVFGWSTVLLDSEFIGLANLFHPKTLATGEDNTNPWTIAAVAMEQMASGNKPDVYPEDFIPILQVDPALVKDYLSGINEADKQESAVLSQDMLDEENFL